MYHCGSSPTRGILWLDMCWILITQAREKRLRWISCGRLPTKQVMVKTTCCVMYHYGSSPTKIIWWLEMFRILITQAREKRLRWIITLSREKRLMWIMLLKTTRCDYGSGYAITQAREKRLRWISCGRLPTTSKCVVMCNVPLWFKPTKAILWLEMCRILITQAREKRLRWISCGRLPQRASGLVVKTTCCVMYHCGSSPTKIIWWLEMFRILITQAWKKVKVNVEASITQARAS